MGKLKEGSTQTANSGGGSKSSSSKAWLVPFLVNLIRTDLYKPNQGKNARLLTAIGMGVIVVLGAWRAYDVFDTAATVTRYSVPAVGALIFGWICFRILHYPPFAEFLVATQAEMNKVSWTSRDDLRRATAVVLSTVVIMALFLFGVDQVWSYLLHLIGVLRFGDTSSFGDQSG